MSDPSVFLTDFRTMNAQLHQKWLYYALVAIAVLSTLYLLSAFGLFDIYPHFFGKTHPHRWHTLFRMCFVIAFAVVNHWFLVPHFYIKRRYLFFFSIVLLCLVSLLVLPDLMLKPPKFDPKMLKENPPPPFVRTLIVELAHMYLLFFISTFTSIAIRTRQYMEQLEDQHTLSRIPIEGKNEETIKVKPIETALTVTVNYSLMRIEFSDILFIKSMDNYLQFHLKDKKPLVVRMTLKEAIEKLPNTEFLRVHKSYIVATTAIESIRNKIISIAKQDIPIGKAYEEALSKVFEK
jgi:LytTr DNA-binding domain